MSETASPKPTPFEKLEAITRQILSVPKAEIDRREEEWRKNKSAKRAAKQTGVGAV